ncbi:MAG TPA: metalloregulator ArsR/SmtB family transcription factor [Planctomycetaceae bacterium]|jgi:DNA-binding transcriptional ArsR family regulator|nr:metalloregulator ArsR/SmtB family transcription factor [Planctomycetaceae bacterium]
MVVARRKQHDRVFKAIADPTRREILSLLTGGQRSVGQIARNFRTSRPAISRHLRLLRRAGLVVSRKQGTTSICELNGKPLRAVSDWLRYYEVFWNGNLRNLKQFAEDNPSLPAPSARAGISRAL